MKHKRETIQKIIASMRKNSLLNQRYSNPSMIEKEPTEDGVTCKKCSYIVEWQMQHHEPDYFPKQEYIEE